MAGAARGFSLVEVAMAIAIAAGGLVVIVALLGRLVAQTHSPLERAAAAGLADAVAVELRSAVMRRGWAVVVADAGRPGALRYTAARDAAGLRPWTAGQGAPEDAFFLVEASRAPGDAPQFEAGVASLPLHVRVSWPARAAGREVPDAARDSGQFLLVLTR